MDGVDEHSKPPVVGDAVPSAPATEARTMATASPAVGSDAAALALEQALKAALRDAVQRARTLVTVNERAGAATATATAKRHKVGAE